MTSWAADLFRRLASRGGQLVSSDNRQYRKYSARFRSLPFGAISVDNVKRLAIRGLYRQREGARATENRSVALARQTRERVQEFVAWNV